MSRNYTIDINFSIPVRRFWGVVVPVILGVAALGALLGFVVVDRLILPHIVGVNKGVVEVPNVRGMEFEAGRQRLYDLGLFAHVKDEEFNDSVPEGSIARQSVQAGEKVKRGRYVDVAVSKGHLLATIPPVAGMADHIARLELRKKGFTVGKSTKKYHDKIPAGQIIAAVPPEGTTISREMSVALTVSEGPKPTNAEMVNVVGEDLGSARTKIEEAGLTVKNIDYRENPSLTPGTVLSQSVPPGTNVPLGNSVDLVVSVARK